MEKLIGPINPNQRIMTVEELVSIIGQKEIEIIALRNLLMQKDEEINVLKKTTK